MNDWLQVQGKTFVVTGAANRRSVAFAIGKALQAAGARVIWTVHTPERRQELRARLEGDILICDVRQQESIDRVAKEIADLTDGVHGLVHSIAFANYTEGLQPFHRTVRDDFLDAVNVSAFSLVALARALEEQFTADAAVVTISISTTRMASESYGYMAPVKAALDSAVAFLAKSFSTRGVRFNAVQAGLLKTSSSAGIPGYLDSYLFAEKAIPRKSGLATGEVADTALFLLSPRSSGINAQGVVVDAGMEINYFDAELVKKVTAVPEP